LKRGNVPMSLEKIRHQIKGEIRERESTFREHEVISILIKYLAKNGWSVKEKTSVDGGSIDVGAEKGGKILLIEAKGEDKGGYTSAEMNFQIGLGQIMSRMKHRDSEYGIAFPITRDFVKVLRKYHGSFAFEKLGIYFLPVSKDGTCRIVPPADILKFLEKIT